MKRFVSILFCAAVVGLIPSCKPKAGGSCTENAAACDSPTSRLACVNGLYAVEACKGPKGCSVVKDKVECDSMHGDVGDPCVSANTVICSTDAHGKLMCQNNKLVQIGRCDGDGCTVDDTRGLAHCANPYAIEGDVCTEGGACSQDGKAELKCKGGKMVKVRMCRGDEACSALQSGPNCDRSTAIIGDDCDPNDAELSVACEKTNETILICKTGKFEQGPTCKGDSKCSVAHYGIDGRRHFKAGCDQSRAAEGDDCLAEGPNHGQACTIDLKARLACQNGKFVMDKVCKKKPGCQIHSATGNFACE